MAQLASWLMRAHLGTIEAVKVPQSRDTVALLHSRVNTPELGAVSVQKPVGRERKYSVFW